MGRKSSELWAEIVCAVSLLVFDDIDPLHQRLVSKALAHTRDLKDNVVYYVEGKYPNDPDEVEHDI